MLALQLQATSAAAHHQLEPNRVLSLHLDMHSIVVKYQQDVDQHVTAHPTSPLS